MTCMVLKLLGHKIGRNVRISLLAYVHADEIELGNDVVIKPFVFISVSRLAIGSNSIISFGT